MVNLIIKKQGNYYHVGVDGISRFITMAIASDKVRAFKLLTNMYRVLN